MSVDENPLVSEFSCGDGEARLLIRASRRCRWLVRGWSAAALAVAASAIVNLALWVLNQSVLTGIVGALSGALTIPGIRFAKSNAEDADVFELLAARITDPTASAVQRDAICRKVAIYIDSRLPRAKD